MLAHNDGTVHPPLCWQNELRDCITNAIRLASLCTSVADLSALYNNRHFPLWPGFQSTLFPKEATTDACTERLTSEFRVSLSRTDVPSTDTQVKGEAIPSAFWGEADAKNEDGHDVNDGDADGASDADGFWDSWCWCEWCLRLMRLMLMVWTLQRDAGTDDVNDVDS